MGNIVKELKTENQERPIGLLTFTPRFSWKLEGSHNGSGQSAYRIQVMDEENLMWDTGKRVGEQTIDVRYEGTSLKPLTRYQWKVTSWDESGEENIAESWFETSREGINWTGSWVEPVQEPTISNKNDKVDSDPLIAKKEEMKREEFRPCQFLRLPIQVRKEIRYARIFATAHGVYRLELNGQRVDDRELAPEITPYDTMLQYQTYDITSQLQTGENIIGITLGDGWWIGRVGITGECCQFGNKLGLLIEVRLEYKDGTTEIFNGEQCVSAHGPILYSDLFVGEKYDARREMEGWSTIQYDDHTWTPVNKVEYSLDNLIPQQGPVVRAILSFTPEKIITTPEGDTVIDIGQNISGKLQLTMDAREGQTIVLEHAEVLDENGNFFNNIMGVNKDQKDIYITKEGKQSYTPWFTTHGFRYVRVTGWPGELSINQIQALVLSSDVKDTGEFTTSSKELNRLQQNIWWSQVANTLSIPTDCPQRERAGWTGDIFVFSPTAAFNRDVDAFLTRWLMECRHSQLEAGEIPMIVPYFPGYRSVAETVKTHTSCGWGDAIIGVPWALYMAYNNKQVLEENYEAMKRWVGFAEDRVRNHQPLGYKHYSEERKKRSQYLWNTDFHYGDWLIPSMLMQEDADASIMGVTALLTMNIVGPAYFAYSTSKISEIARLLGHMEDAKYYEALYEKVRKAYIEEYVHEDGTMDADFQGIYVITLQMGLVTEEVRPKMVQHLCDLIAQNGYRLDTGFLSVPFLMDVLCKNGRRDVAYKLLYQDECPSWLYEVRNGATTMWEAWQAITPQGQVSNASYNHYAFGCIGDWMYREIGGLIPQTPGYQKMYIRPGVDSGLTSCHIKRETMFGTVGVDWKIIDGNVQLTVRIPVGCEADVILPECVLLEGKQITVENHRLFIKSGVYHMQYSVEEGKKLCAIPFEKDHSTFEEPCEYAAYKKSRKGINGDTTLGELFTNKGALKVLKKVDPTIEDNRLARAATTMTIEQLMTFLQITPMQYHLLLMALKIGSFFGR